MSERVAAADSEDLWTIRRVLGWTTAHFEKREVDAPRLTAEILLGHSLKLSRVQLYVDLDRPLSKAELTSFRGLIERRLSGEPTQYLTGFRDFYNHRFKVDSRVLIPRPETELLVEAVLQHLPKDSTASVVDLCTGTGCVAASVALARPGVFMVATELSPQAFQVAEENFKTLGLSERVRLIQADLFEGARPQEGETFEVIVSNPPYVRTGEIEKLQREVRKEPRTALDGGVDGLDLVRRIISGALERLSPGGLLALEIGEEQGPAVLSLLQDAGFASARIEKDLARLDRLALANKPAAPAPAVTRAHPRPSKPPWTKSS